MAYKKMAKCEMKEVEVAEKEYVEVPAKPAVHRMRVDELLAEVEKYKSLCEDTNVCVVHMDGRRLVLS